MFPGKDAPGLFAGPGPPRFGALKAASRTEQLKPDGAALDKDAISFAERRRLRCIGKKLKVLLIPQEEMI